MPEEKCLQHIKLFLGTLPTPPAPLAPPPDPLEQPTLPERMDTDR